MKQVLLITLLLILASPLSSQVQDKYADFKTGVFTYEGKEGEVEIIRTKTKQTETFNGGKSKLSMSIEWLNDSTYLLTHKKSKNAPGCLEKGDWTKVKVTKKEGNRYECSYITERCGNGKCVIIKLK